MCEKGKGKPLTQSSSYTKLSLTPAFLDTPSGPPNQVVVLAVP